MLTYGQKLEKKGYDEGIKKGVAEGQRALVLRLLTRRFGAVPAKFETRVLRATHDELERWSDRILDATTLDEVFAGS
ncbi:DUF4351 domain-containing protein [Haliangium sp.]|uniref:DUF4351 domain-containing protein n=1 Tax=Haliangium sp. TaxID=2663208 RepID=UPI003D113F00